MLSTVGGYYEVTILDDVDAISGEIKSSTIRGELRGWDFDEDRGIAYAIIFENGATRAEEYFTGDILAVKPMEKAIANENMFFTPFKERTTEIGLNVDVYRNLHTNNGYSIRCAKTKLVLTHCSTVHLINARFHVSESGRQKTVREKRKRVHAFVRGELVAYNVLVPNDFVKVLYNPYHTPLFMESETNTPIMEAEEVICCGKYAYAKKKTKEIDLFDIKGENHE